MRELSLFSGAGGGLLGSLLLGWRPVGYVEWDDYCQRVIAARIADGILPAAPIFGDVREFVQSGAAAEYRGIADVVSGGFPCQPFSLAGKQLGADDDRNMWPATINVIRIVRPKHVFLENVPGLISSGYIVTVIDDLRQAGYQVLPPLKLSASDVGANHRRRRIWIVAHAQGQQMGITRQSRQHIGMGHTTSERLQNRDSRTLLESRTQQRLERPSWWATEPDICRVANGVAARVDRIRAIGNGQVPLVAATAWRLLTEGIC